MSEYPPMRLLDDPSIEAPLREDLKHASAVAPVAYDVGVGLETFRARAADSATLAAGGGNALAGPLLGSSAMKWWALSAAGLAVLGAVGLTVLRGDPATPSEHTKSRSMVPSQVTGTDSSAMAAEANHRVSAAISGVQVAAQRSGGESDGLEEPQVGAGESRAAQGATAAKPPASPRLAARSHRRSRPMSRALTSAQPATSEAAVDTDARKLREIRQLAQARRSLEVQPAAALAAARAGQMEFPDGMFVQERAALIVFALDGLGRAGEARTAAEAYLTRYPQGPFSERVRRIVEAMP